jgi:hypothetical protein
MIGLEINDAVIVEQNQILEQAISTNPKTQKALQKLIRQVIMEAREKVVGNIKFDNGDPRHTARAVRTAVYKKILGANINVYNGRKAHGSNNYEAPRTLRPGQRGGNRVPRGRNTERMLRYAPNDRQMILRWVNSGTGERTAGTRGGRIGGSRGSIAARNFFRGAAERSLVQAADNLANLIDTELETILSKKN